MCKIRVILLLACLFFLIPHTILTGDSINVFYAGQNGALSITLGLDKSIHQVTDNTTANVFILDGETTHSDDIPQHHRLSARLPLKMGWMDTQKSEPITGSL